MPTMRKTHFELIARVLNEFCDDSEPELLRELAEAFADELVDTQPPGQFDRDRFIDLVLYGPEE